MGGGEPFRLAEIGGYGTWGDDGSIIVATGGRLVQLPWTGGEPRELLAPGEDEPVTFTRPRYLPGSQAVLYEERSGEESRIGVLEIDSGATKILSEQGTNPVWSPTGHVLYARGTVIEAIPFDATTLEVLGPPAPVLQDVQISGSGTARFAIAATGTLAYVPGDDTGLVRRNIVWVARDGSESQIVEYEGAVRAVRLSPDGRRIAAEIGDTATTSTAIDIWLHGIEDGTWVKLNDETRAQGPLWSPDGRRVAFTIFGGDEDGGIAWKPADFSTERELLYQRDDGQLYGLSWSHQDELLIHQMVQGRQIPPAM